MARVDKISSELERFKKIFKNIDEDKRAVVDRLIENAAFMSEELKKLQEYISEHGCTEEYMNGANQFGKKKSSEVDVYNTMIKNYTSVIKQLLDLLPDGQRGSDELMDFISGKK
ncbi:hypothetical protein ACTQ6A_13910 [Lachnospiraceae bacterium LCP25S3_G4]